MDRLTYYDIDFGSYFIREEKECKLSELINKIGELEDKIEELEKNGVNEETRGRIKSSAAAI